jgi:PAS domain S-box-containing protein
MVMLRSSVRHYGLALLATAVALIVSPLLGSLLGKPNLYLTLYVAVVFSAWCCGLAPSILTALSGAVGVWFLFLTPRKSFAFPSRTDLFGLLGFLLVAGFIVVLGEVNRRGQFARLHQASVLDAANDAIIELEPPDDTIRYWNRGAEKLYGWTRAEAVGKNITSLLETRLKTGSPETFDQIRAALTRHNNWEGELIHTRRDGTQVYVASRWTMQQETETEPAIWLEVNRDITERKKAEQELQKAEEARRLARDLAYKELENQVKERTAELEESNQQLRQLSASLIRSQDDERRRIARELHDSAGQYLGAVSIALDVATTEHDSAARKLAEAAEMAKKCTSEIRTISHLLHPPLLEELGFASAAQWYINGFAARSGIQVQVHIPKQLDRLGNDVELVLFRILQESLTNVHRHSGSKTATIRVGTDSQQAWLEVQDQGNGSSLEFRPGIGITGMRERAKDLSGTLEISSNESGTRVRVVLPLSVNRHQSDAM